MIAKRLMFFLALTLVLLIPIKVEAYEVMISYFANGGKVASGNIEIIDNAIFLKNSTKADIKYQSNKTINHINSLDGTNTFTLKKDNNPQTKTREWYATNYLNAKKIYFSNSKTYTVQEIVKKLNLRK